MALSDKEREDLVAFLDGELKAHKAQVLEAKLGFDAAARAEADAFKKTWSLLDYLPRPEPSADFTHKTLERLSVMKTGQAPWSRRSRWRTAGLSLAWAASVFLAVAVGYFAGARVAGPAPDVVALDPADSRVVENLTLYEQVDDLEFLNKLNDPDLFGDEAVGS